AKARPGVSKHLENVLSRALAHYPRRRFQTAQEMREALLEYLAAEPCSQEDVAEFMQNRFGELRQKMQRQIAECLRNAEAQDPVISVTSAEDPGSLSLPEVGFAERSLPLLDSGSLPMQRDEATTPLAPDAMLHSSRPPKPEGFASARSRSITFA